MGDGLFPDDSTSKLTFAAHVQAASPSELLDAIKWNDEWFRTAETFAQQRLQTFSMTGAFIMTACAGTFAVHKPLLLGFFSLVGALLSLFWFVLGHRQCKFHELFEREIDRLLEYHQHAELLPVFNFRKLKLDRDALAHDSPNGLKPLRLNWAEAWLSTRKLLWLVPALFGATFSILIVFALLEWLVPCLRALV